jgi:cell division septal protein FtsQ
MAQRRKAILETPNRRRRKRQRRIRGVILLGLAFCLLVAGIIGFFQIPSLQIREVVITGAEETDPEIIRREAASISSGKLFFFIPKQFVMMYPRKEIVESILHTHKDIQSVEVKIKGVNTAEIIIMERSPEAIYCAVNCFYLDATGLAYEKASSTVGYVVFRDLRPAYQATSSVGVYPLTTETFKALEVFAQKLSELGLHLKDVAIQVNEDINITTEEGRLIISLREPLDGQFDFLKTALLQPVFKNSDDTIRNFGYIDLRFGKKIFYRLDQPAVQATTSATSTFLIQ